MHEAGSSAPDDGRSRQRLQDAVGEDYLVGRLIGRGGFADVFEASDPRLERSVAIKAIRPELVATDGWAERFQREARAMARLRHPNVMEIYTVGEADGVAYFVMPLIDGESLAARLEREGSLPVAVATRILVEAAGALDAAHRIGMVHRDVKPDNILLEGERGRVVIADFGIAKALELDSSVLTGTGMFVGTPRYMSPEQAVGDDLDHRSDIYSLGVVAFEAIAGRLPFEARSAQALVAKHLTEEPPSLTTLRAECPERLARAVRRCLAKDPGDRWASLADLVAELEGSEDPVGPTGTGIESAVGRRGEARGPEGGGTPEARSRDRAVAALHRMALSVSVALAALIVADAVLGFGGLSAWVAPAGVAYVAVRAGRLWREGFEWQELLPWRTGGPVGVGRPLADDEDAAAGRFATLVHGCTGDRATIVKAFADLPRQEQARFPRLRETTETLAQRVKHVARKVVTLEDRIADTAKRVDRGEEGGGADGAIPSSALSRHSARLHELTSARDEAAAELRTCVSGLADIRDAITEQLRMDASLGMDELERALSRAAAYLGQRAE